MKTFDTISVIVTVSLAFIGYILTYWNNVRLENRKSRVKFVSDQIQFLYGPLFALRHACHEAWNAFRSRHRSGRTFFDENDPPSEQEKAEWRLWMCEVFMPLNVQAEETIIANAHLIEGSMMPEPILSFLSHVEVYKAVIAQWKNGDYSQHAAYLNFPEALDPYLEKMWRELKKKQMSLIENH